MDIFKLDHAISPYPEYREKLYDLVLNAVRVNLMWLDRRIEDVKAEIAALEEKPFPVDQESVIMREGERNFTFEVRENMLRILLAMAHIGDKKPDAYPFIDWRAIEEVLDRIKRSECVSSFDFFSEVNSTIRRRGRPADKRPMVIAGIRRAIEEGRYSVEQLKSGNITMDSLAVEFFCSRTTIRAALNEILGNGEADAAGT